MEIRKTSKGRGVYATKGYRNGEVVEKSPVIIFPRNELSEDAILAYYVFEWDKDNYAAALGYGSLFNHSYHPNLLYFIHPQRAEIWFRALRKIEEGEELTTNYNRDPSDQSLVQLLDPIRAKLARGDT